MCNSGDEAVKIGRQLTFLRLQFASTTAQSNLSSRRRASHTTGPGQRSRPSRKHPNRRHRPNHLTIPTLPTLDPPSRSDHRNQTSAPGVAHLTNCCPDRLASIPTVHRPTWKQSCQTNPIRQAGMVAVLAWNCCGCHPKQTTHHP